MQEEDMDEETKRAVEAAEETVAAQLQANARSFASQLRDHLAEAKTNAQEQRRAITQAAKKRKAEGEGA
eukprot:93078-Pyramimonas_sp.AAC.1